MKCYVENRCKKCKNGECVKELCGMRLLINSAYSSSAIPKRYLKDVALEPEQSDFKAFTILKKYITNVVKFVEEGKGIYLYSTNCGNGKTTWSTMIGRAYIHKKAYEQEFQDLVYFVNVADYLEDLKRCFNGGGVTAEVEAPLKDCKLLILDDIGVEKSSEWAIERLYALLNYRCNEEKATIITSNLDLASLRLKLNDRIASRIKDMCVPIELQGSDRRGDF